MVELSRNSRSIFIGRHYGPIQLDIEKVSDFMLFPGKSVDHWGHIIPMLIVLVMLKKFFVKPGYNLLAFSYWPKTTRVPMLPLVPLD